MSGWALQELPKQNPEAAADDERRADKRMVRSGTRSAVQLQSSPLSEIYSERRDAPSSSSGWPKGIWAPGLLIKSLGSGMPWFVYGLEL